MKRNKHGAINALGGERKQNEERAKMIGDWRIFDDCDTKPSESACSIEWMSEWEKSRPTKTKQAVVVYLLRKGTAKP